MKLETVWIARNPTPQSTLEDICFEQSIERLDRYVLGCPLKAWEREQHVIYTTREEAEADARGRLARAAERTEKAAEDESWEGAIGKALEATRTAAEAPAIDVVRSRTARLVSGRFDRALRSARELQFAATGIVVALTSDGIGAATGGIGFSHRAQETETALAELATAKEAFRIAR